jgi:hypothetical protein
MQMQWRVLRGITIVVIDRNSVGKIGLQRVPDCLSAGAATEAHASAITIEQAALRTSCTRLQLRIAERVTQYVRARAGSVIFSQCVLAIRAGVQSRLQGYGLGALQLTTFLLPFSLVHFLPNFYYGSLLMVIGIDIVNEWLFATYPRVKKAEFVLSWLSFACTLALTSLLPVQARRTLAAPPRASACSLLNAMRICTLSRIASSLAASFATTSRLRL